MIRPITAIVVEPSVRSMSAPLPSMPIGWSPSEIVRAVLPTRPSNASGLRLLRAVRYVTRTTLWAMPAIDAAPSSSGICSNARDDGQQDPRRQGPAQQEGAPTACRLARAVSKAPMTVPMP